MLTTKCCLFDWKFCFSFFVIPLLGLNLWPYLPWAEIIVEQNNATETVELHSPVCDIIMIYKKMSVNWLFI